MPGYNIQIATENQFITNYDIFWRPTDQGTLIPFLTSFSDRYGMQSDEVCADSGYGSEQNCAHMFGNGIVPYVKSTSDLGYESTVSRCRAQNCAGCPLSGMCYKGMSNRRTIEVNHQANAYRVEALGFGFLSFSL